MSIAGLSAKALVKLGTSIEITQKNKFTALAVKEFVKLGNVTIVI